MINAKQAKVKSKTTLEDIKAAVRNVYLPKVATQIQTSTDKGEFRTVWESDTIKDREVEPLVQMIKEYGYKVEYVKIEMYHTLTISWEEA